MTFNNKMSLEIRCVEITQYWSLFIGKKKTYSCWCFFLEFFLTLTIGPLQKFATLIILCNPSY